MLRRMLKKIWFLILVAAGFALLGFLGLQFRNFVLDVTFR